MLFDIHDELGKGTNFCDLLQFITVHVSIVGFMDDATCQMNGFHNKHAALEQLIELMHYANLIIHHAKVKNHIIHYKHSIGAQLRTR